MKEPGRKIQEQASFMCEDGPFGIITKPDGDFRRACVLLLNSGLLHRVGPSRLHVSLCRRLAQLGFLSVRIDIAGKGDTPRRQDKDARQSLLLDYDLTCKKMASQFGLQQFILMGLCSGADDAFNIACSRNNVVGMVMLDGYAAKTPKFILKRIGAKALQLSSWSRLPTKLVSKFMRNNGTNQASEDDLNINEIRNFPTIPQARRHFETMSQYMESALCVYTSATKSYYNYQGQLLQVFNNFNPSRGVREEYMPAAKHTFPLLHHRAQIITTICNWADEFQ